MMLIGVALHRRGLLSGRASPIALRRMVRVGLAVGVPP
jgi:hypothetical protein